MPSRSVQLHVRSGARIYTLLAYFLPAALHFVFTFASRTTPSHSLTPLPSTTRSPNTHVFATIYSLPPTPLMPSGVLIIAAVSPIDVTFFGAPKDDALSYKESVPYTLMVTMWLLEEDLTKNALSPQVGDPRSRTSPSTP